MQLLIETLNAFDSSPALLKCMQRYAALRNTFNRDFYTITFDEHSELNDSLKKLLDKLGIPVKQQGRYLNQNMTVYACLIELNNAVKNDKLAAFIQLINEKKQGRWKNMLLWGAGFTVCGLLPYFALQLTVFQQVLTVASIISGGGLIYTIAIAAYTAYDVRANSDASFYQLFRDNFFSVANKALSIAAWSLMAIAAVSTPLVSILFVLSDAMLVIKEAVSLSYLYWHDKPGINDQSSLPEQQKQARDLTDFELRKHTLWVNLAAAIIMTGIIAVWCFAPGGIFVIAGALLAIGGVYLAKNNTIRDHEQRMKTVLKDQFVHIEEPVKKPFVEPLLKDQLNLPNSVTMHAVLTTPAVERKVHTTTTVEIPSMEEEQSGQISGLVENSLFNNDPHHHGHGDARHAPRSRS